MQFNVKQSKAILRQCQKSLQNRNNIHTQKEIKSSGFRLLSSSKVPFLLTRKKSKHVSAGLVYKL